jgi:hypothetical protein
MSGTNLYTIAANINDAFDDLIAAWHEVEPFWNDGVSRRFCEVHLEPMGPITKMALDSTSRMSHVVDSMHRDCDA